MITVTGILLAIALGVGWVLLMHTDRGKVPPRAEQGENILLQLGLAMHSYSAMHGHLPPAAIYDKDDKPLLSWRVLLLPYLEQNTLYKEFHLNEPWDSEHNKQLLTKMPKLFAGPDEKALAAHETHYQVFVGKGTAFEGE
jgi:hypothetical protein